MKKKSQCMQVGAPMTQVSFGAMAVLRIGSYTYICNYCFQAGNNTSGISQHTTARTMSRRGGVTMVAPGAVRSAVGQDQSGHGKERHTRLVTATILRARPGTPG